MTYPKARPVMIAILLVATSLAGCLSTEEVADQPETEATLGTVYTSTWHVQDLVENIAGDRVNVELLAPSNVPVHDYEPTSTDLLYLRDADVFFYHGLGLETWVNTTLESMGDDAPEFVPIHTLPDGSIVLEYEAMLVADLCEHLTDGPFESSNLSHEGHLNEIHAEHVAHRLSFPMHDDDHDDDGDGITLGDDIEGVDDHDEHDMHAGHDHLSPEEIMDNPAGCPTDSVIQMYHMEEGHYVLEFEAEEMMSFDMSVLKMAGGHAHHDHHGHGDHSDEEGDHDEHSDEEGDHDDHSDEEGDHDNHSDGHDDHDDERMTAELALQEYDMDNDTRISWDEFWHAWIEDDHEFYDGCTVNATSIDSNDDYYECWMTEWLDADGSINETDGYEEDECTEVTNSTTGATDGWECERHDGDHDDHHGHDDHSNHSGHEDEGVCFNSEMNMISGMDNETTCGSYVYMTNMSWGDMTFTGCYNTISHAADPNMSAATCDAFMWMQQDDMDERNHLMAMFHHSDMDNNSLLNMTELEHFIEAIHAWEDSHDGHERHDGMFGAIAIHIEVEGDYGFALPHDVTMHIVPGGHDDHDDHSGHDDHSDHGDEHGADGFEWAGIFEMNDATHTWSMQKVGGDYADPSMWLVLIPTDTPTEDTMHSLESGVDALVDGDCTVVEDGESMSSIAASGTCFELHVGTGDDTTYTIDTSGFTGMAMYAQHVPTEFERDQHYLKDSAGTDIEPIAQEGAGAHDHGHGEEEDLGRFDPHSWLDPLSYRAQAALVRDVLIEAFPEGEADFTANAEAYMAELLTLHEEFSSGLAACESRSIAANHNAYAYLAERYDLQFVTVHGLDPEGEPSAAEIQEVVEKIEEEGITIFYVEEYTNEASVNSLVEQTKSGTMPDGVILKTLHTMEMPPKDTNDGYADLMKENLDNLLAGMEC